MDAQESASTAGYRLVRGVLNGEQLERIRARVDRIIAEPTPAAGVDVRAGTVWIRSLRGEADVDALCIEPRVLDCVRELLGPELHVQSVVMRNPVGETAQQQLHVDWAGPIAPGADQQAQALFYLDDVEEDNGPTRVVRGTHRSSRVPDRNLGKTDRHRDEVHVTAQAGDVLVISSHLWHSGTGNRSGRPRRTINIAFMRGPG